MLNSVKKVGNKVGPEKPLELSIPGTGSLVLPATTLEISYGTASPKALVLGPSAFVFEPIALVLHPSV